MPNHKNPAINAAVPPPRSNVRLICLLALLHLGVGPLVILTLSCMSHMARPVMQAVVNPSIDVREHCHAAMDHLLDEVTRSVLGRENSKTGTPVPDDTSKSKDGKAKLWSWKIITAPAASLDDLLDQPPSWRLRTWTPAGSLAPPGPPPRVA